MERKAFCIPATDFDTLGPLSDSDEEQKVLAPRTQKAMAAAARRRQGTFGNSFGQSFSKAAAPLAPKPPMSPLSPVARGPDRQAWADIQTDDEDSFPTWRPTPTKEEAPALKKGSGNPLDKWSWSTAATDADVEEEVSKDASPTSQAQTSIAERASFSSTSSVEEEQSAPAPALAPAPAPAPAAGAQGMAVQLQVVPQVPQVPQGPMQQGMMVAVPAMPGLQGMPFMPFGMGMLPLARAALPFPAQALLTTAPPLAMQQQQQQRQEEEDEVAPGAQLFGAFGGPPFGRSHRFHQKNASMGALDSEARTFTKKHNKGRLSIVCENKVHFHGSVRYALQFTEGELCSADGVGFILSSDLPCTKNIQKIVSVFANRTGRICIRVHDEVERCPQRVKCLEIGDWLEVAADLTQQTVSFTVWPQDGSAPSYATVSFKETLNKARGRVNGLPRSPCGYLAAVIKHLGVSVTLGS